MITFWHNPRCSKSRAGLALLEAANADVNVRLYLQDAPSVTELSAVQKALGVAVIDMMRRGEKTFKELDLSKDLPAQDLLNAMAQNPILIERPIAISDDRAIIGRPTEALQDLL